MVFNQQEDLVRYGQSTQGDMPQRENLLEKKKPTVESIGEFDEDSMKRSWATGQEVTDLPEDGPGGYDLVYINGDNYLENMKTPADTWEVRLIEEVFHRLMFEPGRS